MRRDNPAARAALARRRQRAAQNLKQDNDAASSQASTIPIQEITPTASSTQPSSSALKYRSSSAHASRPPAAHHHTSQIPSVTRPKSAPRTTTPDKPKLTVDTNSNASVSLSYQKMSPLTRRAIEKKKSPTTASVLGDATLTTAALTTSTVRSSPDNKSSALSSTLPTSTRSKSTPKQALLNSEKASQQATSILNAVNARNRYRSASPSKVVSAQMPPSPQSRLAHQEELLASSKRRREALRSRHRFASHSTAQDHHQTPNTATAVVDVASSPSAPSMPQPTVRRRRSPSPLPRTGSPAAAAAASNMSKPIPTRPPPTPPELVVSRATTDTPPRSNHLLQDNNNHIMDRDSPLLARLEKMEITETHRHNASPQHVVIPRRPHPSPREQVLAAGFAAVGLPPPSPRHLQHHSLDNHHHPQESCAVHSSNWEQNNNDVVAMPNSKARVQVRRSPQKERVRTRARSPSPPQRHKTSSPWIERNVSQNHQRPKSSPAAPRAATPERSSSASRLQSRAMQHVRRGESPMAHAARTNNTTSRPSSDVPIQDHHTGRSSPGAEHLSTYLLDTSLTDISTIPDMTQHRMRTDTPLMANTSVREAPTMEAQPMTPPTKQHNKAAIPSFPTSQGMPYVASGQPTRLYQGWSGDDESTLDSVKVQTHDSACLQSGATIVLKSYCRPATLVLERSNEEEELDIDNNNNNNNNHANPESPHRYYRASLSGTGLNRPRELLTIHKIPSDTISTPLSASPRNMDGPRTDTTTSMDLYIGDTVVLHATTRRDMALGFRKFVKQGTSESKLDIGFFAATGSRSEMWILLDARPDRELLVGRAAVNSQKNTSRTSAPETGPIRSGEPILLRNLYNGGILSLSSNGALRLLTDSYDRSNLTSEDPSLLGRLQNHDRLYPTPDDTFQFILSAVPPCPSWVSLGGMNERIFLSGSYILQPRRNQRYEELEDILFGNSAPTSHVLETARRYIPSDENLSPKTKERILIDEVIGSFLGLEGLHIRLKSKTNGASKEQHAFHLFDTDGVTFDVGLRHLVEQILPLSTSYVRVRNFVSFRHPGYEYGRVMQAFCEALDSLLQDYVRFVAQLDWELRKHASADSLTMKTIYYQITPSLHSMSILEHAVQAVGEVKGGALINKLYNLDKRSYMGDTVAKKVLGILLDKATVPYMEMMSLWLRTGKLQDPYAEFMISETKNAGTKQRLDGDSWYTTFGVNDEHIVRAIVTNEWTKEMILTTGKYWNAVHQCRKDSKLPQAPLSVGEIPSLRFNSDSSAIAAYIESTYNAASQAMVDVMLNKFKLVECLQIMKRYFLIDQGDCLMHFLDTAEPELLKKDSDISMGRIQHWLTMAIQMTESHREEYDPVSGGRIPPSPCPLAPTAIRSRCLEESLVDYLDTLYGGGIADKGPVTPARRAYGVNDKGNTGIEVFTIDYVNVPFPISLVLSQNAMANYKLLFRHLFFTKHVERRLISVWRDNQLLKKLDPLRGLLGPTYLLRQRMLHFVQNLIYYMVFEVIESQWMDMLTAIDKSSQFISGKPKTVDDILRVHTEFLQRALEACLLTNRDLIRSLTKVLNTCLLFTDQMKRFMETTRIHDDILSRAAEKRGVVQRNLNERGTSHVARDKRALKLSFDSAREERQAINHRQIRRVGREVNSESYQRMVGRFDEVFTDDLSSFMKQLNSHNSSGTVANLAIRLDYNGFVSSSMGPQTRMW